MSEDPHYKKSSHYWNNIQWSSVNTPSSPGTLTNDLQELPYINYRDSEEHHPPKIYSNKVKNVPQSSQEKPDKKANIQTLLKLHDLTSKLYNLTVSSDEKKNAEHPTTPDSAHKVTVVDRIN